MRDHNKLRAFELADKLALNVYKITNKFPREELFCLTSQIRKSAVSVPSNIVEGCARESEKEYLHFLVIANGSLRELHYQFGLAQRLGFIEGVSEDFESLFNETELVLGGLIRSLRKT